MSVYINEKIKEYANEMPYELRRAMEALNDDTRLAVFFVLLKYGELPFSQIMTELEIPPEYSSKLTYHIKKLQKSALVKNEYIKKEGVNSYSFYNLTEFGEELLNSLIDTIVVPRSKQSITTATENKSIDLEWPERTTVRTTSSNKLERIPLSINAA